MSAMIRSIGSALRSIFGGDAAKVPEAKATDLLKQRPYFLFQFFRLIGTFDVAAENFWIQLGDVDENPEEAAEKIRNWMRENRGQLNWSVHQKVLPDESAFLEEKINQLITNQFKLKNEERLVAERLAAPSHLEVLFEVMALADCLIPKEALLFDLTDSELSKLFLVALHGSVSIEDLELFQAMLSDPAISRRLGEEDFSKSLILAGSSQRILLLFSSERFKTFSPAVQALLSARALSHAIGTSPETERIRVILDHGNFKGIPAASHFAQVTKESLEREGEICEWDTNFLQWSADMLKVVEEEYNDGDTSVAQYLWELEETKT